MKKILIFAAISIFLIPQFVYAHPPVRISAGYSKLTKTLDVIIAHRVKNPKLHFVEVVTVSLDGEVVLIKKFDEQDNHETQIVSFDMPWAKRGEVYEIEATCNKSGKLSRKVTIK